MSNNKKIVSILFSVVVLSSSGQVSAINLRQFNPSGWNIVGRLSTLNIGFPRFLKGSIANKKLADIELCDFSSDQEKTVEETTSQGFFSKFFSRPSFEMSTFNVKDRLVRLFSFAWLKRNKKSSVYVPSTFPEVDLQRGTLEQKSVLSACDTFEGFFSHEEIATKLAQEDSIRARSNIEGGINRIGQ